MDSNKRRKMILIASLLIVVLAIVTIVLSVHFNRSDDDPWSWTASQIGQIRIAVLLFYEETGSWPDDEHWRNQLKPFFAGQRMPTKQHAYFLDAWGNEIKYVVTQADVGTIRSIYSFGSNKLDEKGFGDDIASEIKAPQLPNDQ
jgi:hypothetical protein